MLNLPPEEYRAGFYWTYNKVTEPFSAPFNFDGVIYTLGLRIFAPEKRGRVQNEQKRGEFLIGLFSLVRIYPTILVLLAKVHGHEC